MDKRNTKITYKDVIEALNSLKVLGTGIDIINN